MEYDPANDRPYHETVVCIINQATSSDEAAGIVDLLVTTACPANHDAIIKSWRALLKRLNLPDSHGVIAAMEAKKAHANEQAEKKLEEQRLSTELSKRIMDFFSTNLHGALTVGGGLRFVHEVCQMTRDELLGFMSEEGVAEVEATLANAGLRLGMDIGPELRAKLPTRCGL
jgi:hypothetical protein